MLNKAFSYSKLRAFYIGYINKGNLFETINPTFEWNIKCSLKLLNLTKTGGTGGWDGCFNNK